MSDEDVIDELQKAVKRILKGRDAGTLSMVEKAGLIICTRAIMHQLDQFDYDLQNRGWALINSVGSDTWIEPPVKSTTELIYRSLN